MGLSRDQGPVGALLAMVVVVAAAGGWLLLRETPPAERHQAAAAPQAVPGAPPACDFAPLVPAQARGDGQFKPDDPGKARSPIDAGTMVSQGQGMALQGRPRDAEVAYIAGCRVAGLFAPAPSSEVADVLLLLGKHYLTLAAMGGNTGGPPLKPDQRAALLRRAHALFDESKSAFSEALGPGHAKTQLATSAQATAGQELAEAGIAVAGAGPAPPPASAPAPTVSAPAPAPAPVAIAPAPAPIPKPAVVAAAPKPVPKVVPKIRPRQPEPKVARAPARPAVRQSTGSPNAAPLPEPAEAEPPIAAARPSFDCGRARSRNERVICGDAQLAQLDRELGSLHARARLASGNPEDFNRRSGRVWREREASCRGDRICLLGWFASRRQQLLDELRATQRAQAPVR